jgi:hypothetical protein
MRKELNAFVRAAASMGALALTILASPLQAQSGARADRGPLDPYLMDKDAEIALARSAAPSFISDQAAIYVLTPRGYALAANGSNGFTCFVDRSWSKLFQDLDFWNPNMRGPTCLNPPARSILTLTEMVTQWALADHSKAQIEAETKTAVERKEFPAIEPGAMSYMMSKDQWLASPSTPGAPSNWKPHVMFYFPDADPDTWGAAKLNTVLVITRMPQSFIVVMAPVSRWSDGTPATH